MSGPAGKAAPVMRGGPQTDRCTPHAALGLAPGIPTGTKVRMKFQKLRRWEFAGRPSTAIGTDARTACLRPGRPPIGGVLSPERCAADRIA
jgi:hypothetical protein